MRVLDFAVVQNRMDALESERKIGRRVRHRGRRGRIAVVRRIGAVGSRGVPADGRADRAVATATADRRVPDHIVRAAHT